MHKNTKPLDDIYNGRNIKIFMSLTKAIGSLG